MLPQLKSVLKDSGLSDKEIAVYGHLLPLGSSSVRLLSSKTGVNRGSVHDALHGLESMGLVHKEKFGKQVHFIADSPQKLLGSLKQQRISLDRQRASLEEHMDSLLSFYAKQGGRPSVEYFDNDRGIRTILEDVLTTSDKLKEKVYYVYSSKSVRSYLYKLFPTFTKEKVRRGIQTRVIALGEGGDPDNLKMAQRRWIKTDAPAYIIIYGNRLALISVSDDKKPFGVLVRDEKIALTQKIIFNQLWNRV